MKPTPFLACLLAVVVRGPLWAAETDQKAALPNSSAGSSLGMKRMNTMKYQFDNAILSMAFAGAIVPAVFRCNFIGRHSLERNQPLLASSASMG
jgi:hypothetical protein